MHCSVMLCRLFAAQLCYSILVRDVGIEPTSSRLKGECISISANPARESCKFWSRLALNFFANFAAHSFASFAVKSFDCRP